MQKVIQRKRLAKKKSWLKRRRKVRLCKDRNCSVLTGEESMMGR